MRLEIPAGDRLPALRLSAFLPGIAPGRSAVQHRVLSSTGAHAPAGVCIFHLPAPQTMDQQKVDGQLYLDRIGDRTDQLPGQDLSTYLSSWNKPTWTCLNCRSIIKHLFLNSQSFIMEQQSQDTLFELQVDYEAGAHLKEGVKWAQFIGIMLIVLTAIAAFVLLIAFIALAGVSTFSQGIRESAFSTNASFISIMLLIPMVIGMFIGGIWLFRFATRCRQGINNQDQQSFNAGLMALRNYFILYGILSILGTVGSLLQLIPF